MSFKKTGTVSRNLRFCLVYGFPILIDIVVYYLDWVGCDISKAMLHEAVVDGTDSGDFVHSDMGLGLPFRPASFDGVISISAIQWLCYADSNEQIPKARLNRFFSSLYAVMKVGSTAVLQFYPENAEQAVLISQIASKVGFTGGVVVDYPNSTKAKKYYLCLSFERTYTVPTALSTTGHTVGNADSVTVIGSSKKSGSAAGYSRKDKKPRGTKNRREWITAQKEHRKRQGKEARENTKYTGRKRATPF
jgi:18S rRNA (guanine1575-N7)-methyltransferase